MQSDGVSFQISGAEQMEPKIRIPRSSAGVQACREKADGLQKLMH